MSQVTKEISNSPNVASVSYNGDGGIKLYIRERSFIFKQLNMGQLSLNSIVVTRVNFTSHVRILPTLL